MGLTDSLETRASACPRRLPSLLSSLAHWCSSGSIDRQRWAGSRAARRWVSRRARGRRRRTRSSSPSSSPTAIAAGGSSPSSQVSDAYTRSICMATVRFGHPANAHSTFRLKVSIACRAAEVRQELPPQVDQLPAPRPQAGPPLRRRGEARHRPPLAARQQVCVCIQLDSSPPESGHFSACSRREFCSCAASQMVQDRGAAAGQDGQRDQEPLEHPHQEEAQEDGPRPRHPPAGRRLPRRPP
uniref:Uncharacterized protein n=1 Tax=Aegilops tauschii subsp. strangulata TaxID=200361 RepID=A0A453PHR2_AEGTS